MANASVPTVPVRSGELGPPSPRCPPFATRRRLFLLLCFVVLAVIVAWANLGPVHAYRDARARLEKAAAEVTALEAQRADLQSQLGKLSEADYLESLARQELTYALPGEDVYIFTGSDSESASADTEQAGSSAAEDTGAEAGDRPGFLERLLSGFIGLF